MSIHKVSNATGLSPATALMGAFALLTLFTPTAAQAQVSRPGSQTPAKVRDGTARLVEHRDPAKMLRLAIVLMPPHMAEERQFLEDVQDKTSPLFHQFLTADQWNARFSPAAGDEQAVVAWAASQGLRVTQRFPNRLVVDVEATGGTIEKALGVQLNTYQVGDETHYSNDRDPVLPTALTPVVHSVLGLNSIEHALPNGGAGRYEPRPDYVAGPPVQVGDSAQKDASPSHSQETAGMLNGTNGTSSPPSGYYQPNQMFSSAAYNYGALMNQGHCCNPLNNPGVSPPEASIAIAAYGDVNLSDVGGFQAGFPYLAFNVQKIYIDGTYTCALKKGVVDDDNCVEVTLDTEWSLAMANSQGSPANTAKVYVYEGFNTNPNTVVTLLNTMLMDGHARVMSTSWGCVEFLSCSQSTMDAEDFVYAEMVGQGWTLVAASGDQGATGSCGDVLAVDFPASDPNVVGVGGTQLSETSGLNYEIAWTGGTTPADPTTNPPNPGSCNSNHGGSTGGFSAYTPFWALSAVPSYQRSFGFIARAVPDMALDAYYGHATYYNGSWEAYGGTSVAAPMLAGFFAQENAYLLSFGNKCGSTSTAPCAPLGNANHPIYQVGLNPYGGHPFYDIVAAPFLAATRMTSRLSTTTTSLPTARNQATTRSRAGVPPTCCNWRGRSTGI
jgi:xanthomonalisin